MFTVVLVTETVLIFLSANVPTLGFNTEPSTDSDTVFEVAVFANIAPDLLVVVITEFWIDREEAAEPDALKQKAEYCALFPAVVIFTLSNTRSMPCLINTNTVVPVCSIVPFLTVSFLIEEEPWVSINLAASEVRVKPFKSMVYSATSVGSSKAVEPVVVTVILLFSFSTPFLAPVSADLISAFVYEVWSPPISTSVASAA